ncbi:MAG: MMPL family transporter [Elusimicrobia bacterium]|nr:MMPL family transporter [Elusimicrobiota bacterium]
MTKLFERWVLYRSRGLWIFSLFTLLLGISALGVRVKAPLENLVPRTHPFMRTFLPLRNAFGGANVFLVALVPREGDIFNPTFFKILEETTNAVLQLPGVDRGRVRSLFTPDVRTLTITSGGYEGENVVPSDFAGTKNDFERVKTNIGLNKEAQRLVARDFRGAMIRGSLLDLDPAMGAPLDTGPSARALESLRQRWQTPDLQVHILGFATLAGDMAQGARKILAFFALAGVLSALLLRRIVRYWSLTGMALLAALLPVVWLVGLLRMLRYGINPLSMLIPFLVFALGLSHGAQMVNAWARERRAGATPADAAARSMDAMRLPAVLALATDAFGFLILFLVPVPMIQEIGVTAGIGVALIIFSNLLFLPMLLSFSAAVPTDRPSRADGVWRGLSEASRGKPAVILLILALLLGGGAAYWGRRVVVGSTHPGVPELRWNSRYNQDWRAVANLFPVGLDLLTVYVQGPTEITQDFETTRAIDRFAERMRAVPGVQRVISSADGVRAANVLQNEGFPKWAGLPHHPQTLGAYANLAGVEQGLMNAAADTLQLLVFTQGNEASVLAPVVAAAKEAARDLSTDRTRFLLGGGNVAVLAATNETVARFNRVLLWGIWGAVGLCCLIAFRSLRGALIVTLPLLLASLLANGLMALAGIGITLSTLPVVSLGVGVGVDFAVYLYESYAAGRRSGRTRDQALLDAYRTRGRMVAFTASATSLGVGLWVFSPLKLQADMGGLLAFLFLANAGMAFLLLPPLIGLFERKTTGGGKSDGFLRGPERGFPQNPPSPLRSNASPPLF